MYMKTKTLGRPVGAGSFESVEISEIIKYMGKDAQIPVSRIWWKTVREHIVSNRVNPLDRKFLPPKMEPVEEPKLSLAEVQEIINKEYQKLVSRTTH